MRRMSVVVGIYILVIGIVLSVIGFAVNAPKNVLWDRGLKVSENIDKTNDVKAFSSISVGDGIGKVIIRGNQNTSDGKYQIQVKGDSRRAPSYTIKGGTLYITRKSDRSGFSLSTQDQVIYVYVPKNTTLDAIDASADSDDLSMTGITTKKLSLESSTNYQSARISIDKTNVTDSAAVDYSGSGLTFKDSTINHLAFKGNDDNTYSGDDDGDYDEDDVEQEEATLSFRNSKISNSTINLREGNLYADEDSTFDNVQTTIRQGFVQLQGTKLVAKNDFTIGTGMFLANSPQVDGVDLSNEKGRIHYLSNSTDDHSFQMNQDTENLLTVKGKNTPIRIK